METVNTTEPRIYRTIRFSFSGRPRTLRNNLTLSEAQAICRRPDTSSHSTGKGSWFVGYDYMRGCAPKANDKPDLSRKAWDRAEHDFTPDQ
jgi:hypothetical protein